MNIVRRERNANFVPRGHIAYFQNIRLFFWWFTVRELSFSHRTILQNNVQLAIDIIRIYLIRFRYQNSLRYPKGDGSSTSYEPYVGRRKKN